jgi:hypothetical protein
MCLIGDNTAGLTQNLVPKKRLCQKNKKAGPEKLNKLPDI